VVAEFDFASDPLSRTSLQPVEAATVMRYQISHRLNLVAVAENHQSGSKSQIDLKAVGFVRGSRRGRWSVAAGSWWQFAGVVRDQDSQIKKSQVCSPMQEGG